MHAPTLIQMDFDPLESVPKFVRSRTHKIFLSISQFVQIRYNPLVSPMRHIVEYLKIIGFDVRAPMRP